MEEIWKAVVGLPQYEVSSFGRVRSVPRLARISEADKRQKVFLSGRVLKPFVGHHGYRRVTLYSDGKQIKKLVHVLVCEAFHGPRPPGFQASHKNGRSSENDAGNLRWLSIQDNADEKEAHGTVVRGEAIFTSVLTEAEVKHIRIRHSRGETFSEIARSYGVSQPTISKICKRIRWKHVA